MKCSTGLGAIALSLARMEQRQGMEVWQCLNKTKEQAVLLYLRPDHAPEVLAQVKRYLVSNLTMLN